MVVSRVVNQLKLDQAILQLNALRQSLARPDLSVFETQVFFDRAVDLANLAAEVFLRQRHVGPVPISALERMRQTVAQLQISGSSDLPDVEDLIWEIEVRNASAHAAQTSQAANAQVLQAEKNARRLLSAVYTALFTSPLDDPSEPRR
jgi:hypothetical protein